jgi:hypothetical protein
VSFPSTRTPAGDLDTEAVWIEHEHLVVAVEVLVNFRREVNVRAYCQGALVGGIDLRVGVGVAVSAAARAST